MTIQEIREFNLNDALNNDLFECHKKFTFEEWKNDRETWIWFYWSMVLIRENVLELTEQGKLSKELQTEIFSRHGDIFAEKFPNMYPEQKK